MVQVPIQDALRRRPGFFRLGTRSPVGRRLRFQALASIQAYRGGDVMQLFKLAELDAAKTWISRKERAGA